MEVIAIGGKNPSGYLKVVHTDDPELVLDELNERSSCELKIKWRTTLPEHIEFSDYIDEVEEHAEHSIAVDGWYEISTYRLKKILSAMEDDDEKWEKGEDYVYPDEVRDQDFLRSGGSY